jgi:Ca-activated chloride channel family protein
LIVEYPIIQPLIKELLSSLKTVFIRSILISFIAGWSILCLFCIHSSFAQRSNLYGAKTSRILFVLDASGSMKGQWQGSTKFDLSKKILLHTIDSISRINPRVEFAVRVMGHQSPRAANNCRDSKLEVPFSKNNLSLIASRLGGVRAQGQTPIAYTLQQSIEDFPIDSLATNAIVLITDGNETCGGNICEASEAMQQKGIVLKPFIVGLGLTDSLKKKFECAGSFYDVQNETMFDQVMRVVISRALNPTTAQVNLLDAFGKPSETNVEVTIYGHNSSQVKYQFLHTFNAKGNPDTLLIDPKKTYDMVVHSVPPVSKKDIELVPGIHNTIAVDVPQGSLELKLESGVTGFSNVPCIIRKSGQEEILYVQDFNSTRKYLVGDYDLELLTLPRMVMKGVKIEPSNVTSIKIPRIGTLSVSPQEPGVASVFQKDSTSMIKIYDFYQLTSAKTLGLQPGKYIVVFRPDKGKQSLKTRQYVVQITSGKTTSVKL